MSQLPVSQYELTAMLFNLKTPDLKAPEKLILLTLSHYGDKNGSSIYPSLTRLSEYTCMSRRALIENLGKLEAKGYIGIIKGGVKDGKNITNTYAINMEKLGYEYDGKGNVVSAGHLSLVQ